MSTEVLRVLGYMAGGVAVVMGLLLLELLLSGLVNRFAGRQDWYRHRMGAQLPRLRQ
jgi:hypothetical protein